MTHFDLEFIINNELKSLVICADGITLNNEYVVHSVSAIGDLSLSSFVLLTSITRSPPAIEIAYTMLSPKYAVMESAQLLCKMRKYVSTNQNRTNICFYKRTITPVK